MWHCGTSELAALHWIVIFLQHQHCYDPDRQSPHLVSLIDGSCEVHQEQQNCFSETSAALVWLRHLETEYLTLHGRGSSFGFHSHLPSPLLLLVAAHPLHLRPRGCFLQHWKVREVSASPQLQLPGFNLRFGILLHVFQFIIIFL